MSRGTLGLSIGLAAALASVGADGCGESAAGQPCGTAVDCDPGQRCLAGRCQSPPAAGDGGAGDGGAADARAPDAAACDDGGACQDDSYCRAGQCAAWLPGELDSQCQRPRSSGPWRLELQCAWAGPPPGDPYPTQRAVRHTPVVANLGIAADADSPPRPSVVFISDDSYHGAEKDDGGVILRQCGSAGTLRVVDGATCREIASAADLGDDALVSATVTPALGDLDGDGAPEIVAAGAAGGILAFTWSPTEQRLVLLWRSHNADGTDDPWGSNLCQWGGVTLADLDDDGRPEVILDGAVWGPDGMRLATVPGWKHVPWGVPAIVADVDGDGQPELVAGTGTWRWDNGARGFGLAPSFDPDAGALGHTAIGDFDRDGTPEVVVAAAGTLIVQTTGGAPVVTLTAPTHDGGVADGGTPQYPRDNGGGPPTAADFNGDGFPEVGVAFSHHYVVADVRQGMILWAQPSVDASSARTGSSAFDFDGDGRAEVVYGDECYVRLYDGSTGAVLLSQARYSSTWHENPIVVDVDGDAAAELVVPMSGACRPATCPLWDELFAGLRCAAATDCPAGGCDQGLCRCAADPDCGPSYACTDPLPGTPGEGRVCRARHRDCQPGLRIYREAHDRFVGAGPIWNQHAYSVTNVNDDGTIPRTSEAVQPEALNWLRPDLDNFRQSAAGLLAGAPGADLTVAGLVAACESESTQLTAEVCNRGPALADLGVGVVFHQPGGEELCRVRTTEPIPGGHCATVSCLAAVLVSGPFAAVVNADEAVAECAAGNNGAGAEAHCLP